MCRQLCHGILCGWECTNRCYFFFVIEWLPTSHQILVCLQALSWGLGELVAAAVGWYFSLFYTYLYDADCPRPFISEYTCGTGPDELSTEQAIAHQSRAVHSSSSSSCHYVSNKGWRFVWLTFWLHHPIPLSLSLLLPPPRDTKVSPLAP